MSDDLARDRARAAKPEMRFVVQACELIGIVEEMIRRDREAAAGMIALALQECADTESARWQACERCAARSPAAITEDEIVEAMRATDASDIERVPDCSEIKTDDGRSVDVVEDEGVNDGALCSYCDRDAVMWLDDDPVCSHCYSDAGEDAEADED